MGLEEKMTRSLSGDYPNQYSSSKDLIIGSFVMTVFGIVGIYFFESAVALVIFGFLAFSGVVTFGSYYFQRKRFLPIPEAIASRSEKALKKIVSGTDGIYVDVETTGIDWDDEVIEIAVLDEDGQVLLDSLIRPTSRTSISKEAKKTHKISKRMLKKEPTWETIYPLLKELLEGKVIRTYNADFDKRLLEQTCKAWDLPIFTNQFVCIMKAYSIHAGHLKDRSRDYKWWKLNDITFWVYPDGRVKGRRHRALTDCREAHAVAKKMEQFV